MLDDIVKCADPCPSSSTYIKNGKGRRNLIRQLKSSQASAVEAKKRNVDSVKTSDKKSKWDEQYKELVSYVKEFGDTRVPQRYTENPALGRWVCNQRRYYKEVAHEKLPKIKSEQIQLLNNIGFEWNLRSTDSWDSRYEELVSYANEFGDTRVPKRFTKNLGLGQWVCNQRDKYKKFVSGKLSGMTSEQIRLLNNIGFEWRVQSRASRINSIRSEEMIKNSHVGITSGSKRKEFEFSC